MPTPSKKHLPVFAILLLIWMTAMACVFTQRPASSPTPPEAGPTVPAGTLPNSPTPLPAATEPSLDIATQAGASQDELLQPDPLDHLLGMRSIQFNLTVTRLDGTMRSRASI